MTLLYSEEVKKSNESQMFKFDPKQEYNTNDKTNAVIPETFFF